jgi:hypothetical protein
MLGRLSVFEPIILTPTSTPPFPEPGFVNLLWSPGIDSQPGGPVHQPYLTDRPARLHKLAESIPRKQFLGSLNVYKFGLRVLYSVPPSTLHVILYNVTIHTGALDRVHEREENHSRTVRKCHTYLKTLCLFSLCVPKQMFATSQQAVSGTF